MKRKSLVCFLLLALLLLLVACGAENPECSPHTDNDGDKKCDECGAEVLSDETVSECTEHTDADKNQKCDNCGADIISDKTTDEPTDEPTVDEPAVDEPTVDDPTDDPIDEPEIPEVIPENPQDSPTTDKPSHEHIPGEAVTENQIQPTCAERGSYDSVIYCTECDTELSREKIFTYKLAHDPEAEVAENLNPKVCAEGTYDAVIYCSMCDAELSREQRPLEAVHNLERKKCLDCGFVKASEGLYYRADTHTMTCSVSKGTCTDTEIGIPAHYGIYSVTSIEGFENSTQITSVVIEDGVQQINGFAFRGCSSLARVDIPESLSMIRDSAFFGTALSSVDISGVKTIGKSAFKECRNLTDITLGNELDVLIDGTFAYCESLSEITLPESLRSIFGAPFYGCTSLVSLKLPDNVHLITSELIAGCENLRTLYFGASLKQLSVLGHDSMYLDDCPSLEHIEVSPDNKIFKSVDGVVYSKDGKKLYYYPINKGEGFFEIPEGVESVGEFAFKGVSSLVSVTLPSTLKLIGTEAFWECYKLVEVINRSGMKLFQNTTNDGSVVYYAKEIHNESETKIKNVNGHLIATYSGVNYYLGYDGDETEITVSDGLPDGVYEIYPYAFYKNDSLTKLTVGEKISNIGENAFYGCTCLTSVTISASVQSIGKYAFSECASLSDVYLESIDGWYVDGVGYLKRLNVTANAAKQLKKTYCDKEWRYAA